MLEFSLESLSSKVWVTHSQVVGTKFCSSQSRKIWLKFHNFALKIKLKIPFALKCIPIFIKISIEEIKENADLTRNNRIFGGLFWKYTHFIENRQFWGLWVNPKPNCKTFFSF